MEYKVLVPPLGESVVEGTIVKWLKKERDKVKTDDPLVEIMTDKINIELISNLSEQGKTIAFFGKVYDKKTGQRLSQLQNVTCFGEFHSEQLPSIMEQFRIGIIPYLKERSHDESPLKAFQYLSYGIPVFSTINYPITSQYFACNESLSTTTLIDELLKLDTRTSTQGREEIATTVTEEMYWNVKIERILDDLISLKAKQSSS